MGARPKRSLRRGSGACSELERPRARVPHAKTTPPATRPSAISISLSPPSSTYAHRRPPRPGRRHQHNAAALGMRKQAIFVATRCVQHHIQTTLHAGFVPTWTPGQHGGGYIEDMERRPTWQGPGAASGVLRPRLETCVWLHVVLLSTFARTNYCFAITAHVYFLLLFHLFHWN